MKSQRSKVGSRKPSSKLLNEKGLALVMVLVLSAIVLVIMAGLIYMLTTGTQLSGMQKRYETALEAGIGGADITYQLIGFRGEASGTATLLNDLSALTPVITTPSSCVTLSTDPACTVIGNYSGLATKLNLPTSCWAGCDSSLTINTATTSTYDITVNLGVNPTYSYYGKIVDTVLGNSGGEEGLIKSGVIASNTGEVPLVSKPYLYTIEVDAERQSSPSERAKLSILYQY